jgi:uncharacterized membrane protein YphA (DoxX/SURF4 family)
MNLALWIVASVLAAIFAASGLSKQLVSKDKLVQSGQGWAQDFSPTSIRLIGVAEVLGSVGVILPAVVHVGAVLVPLAAIGLGLVMVGAAVVNARRKDVALIGVNLVLLALAIFVAWGRLGPYAFTTLTTPGALDVQGWLGGAMSRVLDLSCN